MEPESDGDTNYDWCTQKGPPKAYYGIWRNRNSEVPRLFKRQHYEDQLEYSEESWRSEETCSHSDSSERPSAKSDVKKSKE